MKMMRTEHSPAVGMLRVGTCLCDEAVELLELAPIFGRDVVELDAVCQRLRGVVRLLGLKMWEGRLSELRDSLAAEAERKWMLRAAKRLRKRGRATRDCDAAKRTAAYIDLLPVVPVDQAEATRLIELFGALKIDLEAACVVVDLDEVWLRCRRDYGRVRGLGAAWRDGETRIEYRELSAAVRGVYTGLVILAPANAIDSDEWESLIRSVESLGAFHILHEHLLRQGGRISPAFVVPRTIDLLDDAVEAMDAVAASGHATCFEGRPKSYFSALRRR